MYYLIIIQNNTTSAIYAHNNYDSALVAFHNELAWRGIDRTRTVCVIMDESGMVLRNEIWMKQEEVVESEE